MEAFENEDEGDEAYLPDGFNVFEESEEGDATDREDPGDAVIAIVLASWVSEVDRKCSNNFVEVVVSDHDDSQTWTHWRQLV